MDLAPPTLEPPPDPAPRPTAPAPPPPPGGRIVGGAAGLLATRLGVDALWIRLAFVVLTLVSGIGIVLYAACWLGLVVGPRHHAARAAGGVLLVGGVPLVLLASGGPSMRGPWAVLLLLVGLAIALWQPVRATPAVAPPTRPLGPDPVAPARPPAGDVAPDRPVEAPPRERSVLGRLTLGVAAVVAAVGALIDQANGGRLHPEQWLGAAAVVCGAGLVVGAFVGRARWLVLPAALLAGAGFVAGDVSRIGMDDPALSGSHWIGVGADTPAGARLRQHVVAGSVDVQIGAAPAGPVTVDVRVGVGDIRVSAADDVTVEVRADGGEIRVEGVERPDGTYRIGPEGPADVVVDARVAVGSIAVEPDGLVTTATTLVPMAPGPEVAPGVAIGPGGTVVLVGGEAVLDADGDVLVGDFFPEGQVIVVPTTWGDFRILPNRQLLTPDGQVVDLAVPPPTTADPAPGVTVAPPASPSPTLDVPGTTTGPTGPTVPTVPTVPVTGG